MNTYRYPVARHGWSFLIFLSVLTACGGGGGGGNDDPPPPPPPPTSPVEISIADTSIDEGDNGTDIISFTVTLSRSDSDPVTVEYQTVDATAVAGRDYQTTSGTLTIASGLTMGMIDVSIVNDTVDENDESFSLTLSNPSSNATLTIISAMATIIDNDTIVAPPPPPPPPPPPSGDPGHALNDTGFTTCATNLLDGLQCDDVSDGTDQFPNQDAEMGRDVTDNDNSDGAAGFVFIKLDAMGLPLADQTVDYATTPWTCVEDQVTGLVWEVKTTDGELHDANWTYSWYRDVGRILGSENNGTCFDTLHCDTHKFIDEVRDEVFCGASNWRLPTPQELISIMHFGSSSNLYIDSNFFPNTINIGYWTNKTSLGGSLMAFVRFDNESSTLSSPQFGLAVRLVREAQ